MPPAMDSLPHPIREELDRLCDRLETVAADALLAVILYGGLARNEYAGPGASNVNVLIVLREVSLDLLDRMAAPLRDAMASIRLDPMILGERDLRDATAIFAVRFRDILRHHVVLRGRDVLVGLSVDRECLRLRCEQEIRNLAIRLRRFYVMRMDYPEAVEQTLGRAVSSLLVNLAVLADLKGDPGPETKDAAVEAAGRLGLDPAPLRDALALKRGSLKPDPAALRALYCAFLRTSEQAAGLATALREGAP